MAPEEGTIAFGGTKTVLLDDDMCEALLNLGGSKRTWFSPSFSQHHHHHRREVTASFASALPSYRMVVTAHKPHGTVFGDKIVTQPWIRIMRISKHS